jgi:riboflavin transporter
MNDTTRKAIAISSLLALTFIFFLQTSKEKRKNKGSNAAIISKAGIFGALSSLLYAIPFFSLRLPFFPEFLTIHFDEIPALLIGLAEGPLCAFLVLLCKTFIKLPFTTTASVGEWADLLLSLLFILPVCFFYHKRKNIKDLCFGLSLGAILQLGGAMLANVFILIPAYSSIYGIPMDALLSLCQKANPAIKDLSWGYALFAVLPFNAIKDAAVIALSVALYKALRVFIDKKAR